LGIVVLVFSVAVVWGLSEMPALFGDSPRERIGGELTGVSFVTTALGLSTVIWRNESALGHKDRHCNTVVAG
jgi:hypothetical protein